MAETTETPPPRRSLARRLARGGGIAAASLVGLVVLTLGVVLVGANTGPGRHFLERKTASLTGNTVILTGLGGRFPDALHVARLELRDTRGVWLTLENLQLDWSPLRMIGRTARIDELRFARLAIPRLPVSSSSSSSSSGPTHTGLSLDIRDVDAQRIEVGAPVAGLAAVFTLHGHAAVPKLDALLNEPSFRQLPAADIALGLTRLDAAGTLDLTAKTTADHVALHLTAQDGKDGIVASLAKMPDLTPVLLNLDLSGPTTAAALDFRAGAGAVKASVGGTLNLMTSTADVTASLSAPDMAPTATLGWHAINLNAQVKGPLSAPAGTGTLRVEQLVAGAAQIGTLNASFDGMGQGEQPDRLHLHATATGLRIPGSNPTLLAGDPLELDVSYVPGTGPKPVFLTVRHPLIGLDGQADTAPGIKGSARLSLPDLSPFAAMGGQKLGGHAALATTFSLPQAVGQTGAVTLEGDVAALSGLPQAVALIGPKGHLAAEAHITRQKDGQTIRLDSLAMDGKALHLTANGDVAQAAGKPADVKLQAGLSLPDLAAAATSLRGNAMLDLTASGPVDDLAAQAHLKSDFGTATMPRGPLTADLEASHLPKQMAVHLTAGGTLDRAPLTLDASLSQTPDNTRHLVLTQLNWNSAKGSGKLDLPEKRKLPVGSIDVQIKRLADLRNLIGQPISGSLDGSLTSQAATETAPLKTLIRVEGNVAVDPYRIGALKLAGTVTDPEGAPSTDLTLTLDKVAAPSIAGNLNATVKGPQNALAATAQARFSELYGAPGTLDLAAVTDVPGQRVRITRLDATAKGETVHLEAPATVAFGKTLGVDRLLATLAPRGVTPARIDIAGTLKPALALTANISNVSPDLARPFMPDLRATGQISTDAKLSGTLQAPRGQVHLAGHGLRMMTGDAASLPPAELEASADLAGTSARVNARIGAGPKLNVEADGTVPTAMTGPLALRTHGTLDLSLANAMLGASGRQALGQIDFALVASGTASRPDVTGTVTLHKGDVQDFAQGLHLQNIEASLMAQRDRLVINSFVAEAGKGKINLTGTVGAFAPGMPVDLHLTAAKAQPVASDLITAILDADITVRGQADTRLDVAGNITLPHVEINIPNSMASSVATLNVVRPGDKKPEPTEKVSSRVVALDLRLASPGEFFVRGHGLDAEMAGRLRIGGTTAAPAISGGFDMRRGMFSLGGITLNFTRGRVGFDGTGVQHKLDPTLDFQADRNVNGQTAMLKVTGYASDPKISFESIPTLPQDQVLAMLLFGTDARSLSTTQMAELGAALATLGGGSGFDPLGTVRKTLGLDRLAIGGGSGVGNGGASIEAGKYVMRGVYVGAKQATSGSGTQAQVQVDLTKHLKLNTTVGTGGNVTGFTTPENDPGSSVGLIWQYRY